MKFGFNARLGPIIVNAEVSGPAGVAGATPLLDTGATTSLINCSVLRLVGYDPDQSIDQTQITTGTGVTTVPRIVLNRMSALGRHRIGIRVLAFDLPSATNVDGLLGLDFLRDTMVTIDFRAGEIELI